MLYLLQRLRQDIMVLVPRNNSRDTKMNTQAAVRHYRAGRFTCIRDTATSHGIFYTKLRNGLSGVPPRAEAHTSQQTLTVQEEKVIVNYILRLDNWGFPPCTSYLNSLANHYIRSHGISGTVAGKNWGRRFITRHAILEMRFGIRLDKQREFPNNPAIIRDFFKKVVAHFCITFMFFLHV